MTFTQSLKGVSVNILITGGAGFIGSHLCEKLIDKETHQVYCLDNFSDEIPSDIKDQNLSGLLNHSLFTLFEVGVTDFPGLKQVFDNYYFDHIIHLAGLSRVKQSMEQPLRYSQVNILGTHNILELARQYNIKHLSFASSQHVYGGPKSHSFSESDPCDRPLSPYAATAISAETLCQTYHYLHKMNIAILRLFSVYGPRQNPLQDIHSFSQLIYDNIAIPQNMDDSRKLDYIHVDDVTDGIIRAIDWLDTRSQPTLEIFNLGKSGALTEYELINLIGQKLNIEPIIKWLPVLGEKAGDRVANISKAKKYLGFNPQISIEQGIEDFIAWFLVAQSRYYHSDR